MSVISSCGLDAGGEIVFVSDVVLLVAVLEDFEEAVVTIDFDIVESFWHLHDSYNLQIIKNISPTNNINFYISLPNQSQYKILFLNEGIYLLFSYGKCKGNRKIGPRIEVHSDFNIRVGRLEGFRPVKVPFLHLSILQIAAQLIIPEVIGIIDKAEVMEALTFALYDINQVLGNRCIVYGVFLLCHGLIVALVPVRKLFGQNGPQLQVAETQLFILLFFRTVLLIVPLVLFLGLKHMRWVEP